MCALNFHPVIKPWEEASVDVGGFRLAMCSWPLQGLSPSNAAKDEELGLPSTKI